MAFYIKKKVNGVEQDPKRVGVIPNGYPCRKLSYNNSQSGLDADNPQEAIDELALGKEIHTASANQSFGAQITEIKPYFNALTDSQKMKCALKIDSTGAVFRLFNANGRFLSISVDSASVYIDVFRFDSNKFYSAVNNSVTDNTNQTNTSSLTLMIL